MKAWLRETLILYCQYMAVGVAAIPAGIAYATLVVFHHDSYRTIIPCLIVGFICGHYGWNWIGQKFGKPPEHWPFIDITKKEKSCQDSTKTR
jgi:hypothetical protein